MVIANNSKPEPNSSYSPFTSPGDDTIYGIMVVSALTGNPDIFYTAVAKDLMRVEPCKPDPNDFCMTYQFVPQNP
jgi:hypothetical protein